MISSVTTTAVAVALGPALGLAAAILLILLLASKEVLMAGSGRAALDFGRSLDVAIWPLLMAFLVTVAVKILEVLA